MSQRAATQQVSAPVGLLVNTIESRKRSKSWQTDNYQQKQQQHIKTQLVVASDISLEAKM